MIEILPSSTALLEEFGYAVAEISVRNKAALIFEDATVLGFLFSYQTAADLLKGWEADSDAAIAAHQFSLRRGANKSWNTYSVFLASDGADSVSTVAINNIEEDLSGTRKIARSKVSDSLDLRAALLPLLPIQTAPRLERVDMPAEIRQRTTELPDRVVDAFLSQAAIDIVIGILEETL